MTTHVTSIYHFISCGRIVHAEPEAKPPRCCGRTMTNACTEMIGEGDAGENAGGHSGTSATVDKGPRKAK